MVSGVGVTLLRLTRALEERGHRVRVADMAGVTEGSSVLEIGCGTGRNLIESMSTEVVVTDDGSASGGLAPLSDSTSG